MELKTDKTLVIHLRTDKTIPTWYCFLPPVPATETRHTTGYDHHQADTDSPHNEEQFEVDLAVFTSKPLVAVAGHLSVGQYTLAIPVAELTLCAGSRADPTW